MRRPALSESEAALSARPKSSYEVQREATRSSGAVRRGPVRPRARPAGSYARRARPARAVLSAAGSLDFPSSGLEAIRSAGAVAPLRCDPVSASRSGAGLRRRSAHAAWLQRHLQPRSGAVQVCGGWVPRRICAWMRAMRGIARGFVVCRLTCAIIAQLISGWLVG